MANDSDTSPPQSRGRGRFEKARCKVSSRGQSDALRSASSQAADEESSSHVSVCLLETCCLSWQGASVVDCHRAVAAGPLASADQPRGRRPALRLLPRRRRGEWNQRDAAHRQLQESGCALQVHGELHLYVWIAATLIVLLFLSLINLLTFSLSNYRLITKFLFFHHHVNIKGLQIKLTLFSLVPHRLARRRQHCC